VWCVEPKVPIVGCVEPNGVWCIETKGSLVCSEVGVVC